MALARSQKKTVGLSPGTLVHVGDPRQHHVTESVYFYSEEMFQAGNGLDNLDLSQSKDGQVQTWLHVDGIHDLELIRRLGERFGWHPMMLEDIANAGQRSKVEDYDGYLYIALKWIVAEKMGSSHSQAVSIVLGPGYVVTFQEETGNIFTPVVGRLETKRGRIRKMGNGYLAYTLMDTVVDHYFLLIEELSAMIDALQDDMGSDPDAGHLKRIFALKRTISFLRHALWPMRDLFSRLDQFEDSYFPDSLSPYLHDLHDHSIQVLEALETQAEMMTALHDLHLSLVSNRMNAIMQVLTVIATFFIPLTFIVGLYGMNFKYMPELDKWWGYPMVLALMAGVSLGLYIYFKRKRWF